VESFDGVELAIVGPVATVTLNRPETRNALSNAMVAELLRCFTTLRDEAYAGVRVVVLRAAGSVFCAGGDVRDLASEATPEENHAALAMVDQLLRAVNDAPQVVVARVQGATLGGGVGLVSVSDIAVASEKATFGFPEVRLGLAPSLISPYVLGRIGFTNARRLMLTGARFDAATAQAIGLISEWCPEAELDARVDAVVRDVLQGAPAALRETKRLLFHVAANEDSLNYRMDLLTRLRTSEEAAQGLVAFATKQSPPWASEP
jgi:enoyl-CoA hydratase/carnithine racemase